MIVARRARTSALGGIKAIGLNGVESGAAVAIIYHPLPVQHYLLSRLQMASAKVMAWSYASLFWPAG
jgi:hypothetical protein